MPQGLYSADQSMRVVLTDGAGTNTPGGGTTTSPSVVVGNVAAAATDSGAPVKVGAIYNSTKPTYTNGQRGDLQIGTRGALSIQINGADATTAAAVTTTGADAASNTINALATDARNSVFNSSTWDRAVGMVNATNSTGTGIQACGLIAQRDELSPTAITENQFGNVRMDASRALYVNPTSMKKSYRFVQALLAPTAAGTMIELQGSGSVTLKIHRIKITGKLTTGEYGRFRVFRATAAETSGTTTTAATIAQMDTAHPSGSASSATLKAWTTAGTPGAATAVEDTYTFVPATTAAGTVFEVRFDQAPLAIRGTSEYLVVGSSFGSYTGANFNIMVEWTEE